MHQIHIKPRIGASHQVTNLPNVVQKNPVRTTKRGKPEPLGPRAGMRSYKKGSNSKNSSPPPPPPPTPPKSQPLKNINALLNYSHDGVENIPNSTLNSNSNSNTMSKVTEAEAEAENIKIELNFQKTSLTHKTLASNLAASNTRYDDESDANQANVVWHGSSNSGKKVSDFLLFTRNLTVQTTDYDKSHIFHKEDMPFSWNVNPGEEEGAGGIVGSEEDEYALKYLSEVSRVHCNYIFVSLIHSLQLTCTFPRSPTPPSLAQHKTNPNSAIFTLLSTISLGREVASRTILTRKSKTVSHSLLTWKQLFERPPQGSGVRGSGDVKIAGSYNDETVYAAQMPICRNVSNNKLQKQEQGGSIKMSVACGEEDAVAAVAKFIAKSSSMSDEDDDDDDKDDKDKDNDDDDDSDSEEKYGAGRSRGGDKTEMKARWLSILNDGSVILHNLFVASQPPSGSSGRSKKNLSSSSNSNSDSNNKPNSTNDTARPTLSSILNLLSQAALLPNPEPQPGEDWNDHLQAVLRRLVQTVSLARTYLASVRDGLSRGSRLSTSSSSDTVHFEGVTLASLQSLLKGGEALSVEVEEAEYLRSVVQVCEVWEAKHDRLMGIVEAKEEGERAKRVRHN